MHEVHRHFWKVIIIVLVILAWLWFAPRLRMPPADPPTPQAERG